MWYKFSYSSSVCSVVRKLQAPIVGPVTPPAVAVVDPETPGNIGTIARAMKNFGFHELVLIDAPPLARDGEAYGFAGHAREDVLPNHRRCSFEELIEQYHTVGFTAIPGENGTNPVRAPAVTLTELRDQLATVAGPTALVFGRERTGLTNDELTRLDRICTIPAAASYPTLNLGQAATIALYELAALTDAELQTPPEIERADEAAIERLYDQFETLLLQIGHTPEKQTKTMRLFRRLVARADPTDREVTTLTGVFRRAGDLADSPED